MLQRQAHELCPPSTSGREAAAWPQPSQPRHRRHATRRQQAHTAQTSGQASRRQCQRTHASNGADAGAAQPAADTQEAGGDLEAQVLAALENVIDPDFGESVVACGFVQRLSINPTEGAVSFLLELTTPACPVKEQFRQQCEQQVGALPWVRSVAVEIGARPQQPQQPAGEDPRPEALRKVAHIIAVSSCKGGVGKSTTAVNLAYTLAQMGARVGIFDADVYGPSLPTMVSPQPAVLLSDPVTRRLTPAVYEGVKLVSFGFAGQGSAIMRGAMVSGLIQQLLTTADWGELDYLIVDFPPGTGDIQLTLCQSVPFSAAVIVTTPQKLAFVDVAKGIRMFARLQVPCVAVVENMSYFEVDGTRHRPFGSGAGERICADFGLRNFLQFPIVPDLSAAGDGGKPLVVANPASATAQAFMELGATVVREVAKLQAAAKASLRFEEARGALVLTRADGSEAALQPAFVRRNDTSAASLNEWTGERLGLGADPAGAVPAAIQPIGNYAALIMWQDGFNQVAPFDHLEALAQRQQQELSTAEFDPHAIAVEWEEPVAA